MKSKKKKHIVSPATASEIRRDLGITKRIQRVINRAFKKAGIK